MLNKNNYIVRSYTYTSLCALYQPVDKIILHHLKCVMLAQNISQLWLSDS